ncbi:CFI-box-CTERM domain-containing protein [Planktothrix agardhii]|jgi:hypothetical protein|uniref:CFI-box-CTERM domain-containing protein n=1 Tax=Planktothrix agardhii TaxID=1160 RepID=UPI001D09AA62|nr:CFI-box-CTERM domain-containing protein [Planktothrix agardhii]MCB8749831.1 hypothetical protein [Planktothrix agardhii 1810]
MAGDEVTRMIEKAQREFERYWELGQHFNQQGNKDKASENFVLMFEQFSKMICFEYDPIYLGYDPETYNNANKINSLLSMYKFLDVMFASFYDENHSHKTILAYLFINEKKILDYLSKLESSFSVDDIKGYQEICSSIKNHELLFKTKLNGELEKVKNLMESTQPNKTSDETLKKLRTALAKISELSCFPDFETTGGGCFIATAAYSTTIHPDLDTFRQFRDRTLLTNPLGRVLVSVYYQIGPQLAQYVNRSFYVKKIVRLLLEKLASFMRSRP